MPEGKKMFMTEITDKLEHYVYRLLDPRNGETFYVGMGSDNRVFEHVFVQASKGNGWVAA